MNDKIVSKEMYDTLLRIRVFLTDNMYLDVLKSAQYDVDIYLKAGELYNIVNKAIEKYEIIQENNEAN